MTTDLPQEPGTVPDLDHGIPGPDEPLPPFDALTKSDVADVTHDDYSDEG